MAPEIRNDINALGSLAPVIQPIVEKAADDLNTSQYIVAAANSNLNTNFANACDTTKQQVDQFTRTVSSVLVDPSFNLIVNARDLLHQAAALKQRTQNIDIPLTTVLKDAMESETACITSLAKSLATSVLTNTAAVSKVAQKKTDNTVELSTLPHLLKNQLEMSIDSFKDNVRDCLKTAQDTANLALKNVQPYTAPVVPANVRAAGSNLSGIEITNRNGVEYIDYLVPDIVYTNLNKLNGLGDILRPILEQSSKKIGDGRYKIAQAYDVLAKLLNFAFTRNAEMANDFKTTSQTVLDKINKPIGDMRTSIVNLVKAAVPSLQASPPQVQAAAFKAAIPTFQETILSFGDCIGQMATYTANAVTSAQDTAVQTYNNVYANTQKLFPSMSSEYRAAVRIFMST